MDPPAELFRKRGILQLNFVRMHKVLNFVYACYSLAIAFMHDVGYSENIVRGTAIQRCQTPAVRAAAAGVGAVAEACFSETAGDVAEELVPVRLSFSPYARIPLVMALAGGPASASGRFRAEYGPSRILHCPVSGISEETLLFLPPEVYCLRGLRWRQVSTFSGCPYVA